KDLTLAIIHPDGTRILLVDKLGGSGDNYTNTVFDDEENVSITSAVAPFTGRFSGMGFLSQLNNKSGDGTWYLEVIDSSVGDAGTVNSWSLELSRDSSVTPN